MPLNFKWLTEIEKLGTKLSPHRHLYMLELVIDRECPVQTMSSVSAVL